ncbi:MAG: hypothetical protein QXO15_04955 [Nitrososphaerota archaeon]
MLKPLILFTGPDASGKSTLARLLKHYLERKGLKTKIVRLRGTHTIAYILMKIMRDILKLHGNNLHYYGLMIPEKLIGFWAYIEMLSILPLVINYYYLMRLKYAVVSERSLVDVIVWVLSGVNDNARLTLLHKQLKFLLLLAMRHQKKTFYIVADVYELFLRKPSDKTLVLKMMPYYNAFAKYLELKTINTSRDKPQKCLEALISWLHK